MERYNSFRDEEVFCCCYSNGYYYIFGYFWIVNLVILVLYFLVLCLGIDVCDRGLFFFIGFYLNDNEKYI